MRRQRRRASTRHQPTRLRSRIGRLGAAVVAVAIAVAVANEPASADWEHPVDAPITDSFRPPRTRFGAGNRGLEYGTGGGEVVRAVAVGTVVFAGAVGSHRHVVIDHGEGLRSTSAYVDRIDVVRGQAVRQGQAVAAAGAGFHLTARLGDTYVDPMLLIRGAEVVARLRPGVAPPSTGRHLSPLSATVDAASDLSLSKQLLAIADAADQWHHQECTDDGVAVAAPTGAGAMEDRILIQVGGLGTSSDGASIGGLDHAGLGYDHDNVIGFSYAGGCTPEAFGGGSAALSSEIGTSAYEPADTFQSIDVSAARLAELVERVTRLRPGQRIDLAAHSLGGVVARRALEILDHRGVALEAVDLVVTIGSPHGGADLATGAVAIAGSELDGLLDHVPGAVSEMHGADAVYDIAESGGGDVVDPGPPPDGVQVVAIAGSTDLVVPGAHAMWDGATNVVVPTSVLDATSTHGALPSMPEVQREIELALAGAAPRCVGLGQVIGAAVAAQGISAVEDSVSLVAGLARWLF